MNPLPEDYTLRRELNDEVHTHQYEKLVPPERLSYIALLVNIEERAREWAHLARLCSIYGQVLPRGESKNLHMDLGEFRLKVERHQEFTRYTFVKQGVFDDPFENPVTNHVPGDWLAALPGKTLVAAHIGVVRGEAGEAPPALDEIACYFETDTLAGSRAGSSSSLVFTDFRIREDGFSRFLVIANSRLPTQNGRLLLRLLDVETYRMLALMALPEARSMIAKMPAMDAQLTKVTNAISQGSEENDEALLEDLSKFAAQLESLISLTSYRFAATRAYFGLVANRLAELRETPMEGIPTFGGFLNRRMEPARNTCESAGKWLDLLSNRINQASQLLRTRIDVRREKQNQDLLAAMNRRFHLQLRLQQTVGRLTIAVFTYYSVNLIGYVAEACNVRFRWHIDTILIEAASIPFVAMIAYYLVGRKIRHALVDSEFLN
ncbi:MAG: DUF3422 domain-containing protein [Burkholderiales bacterium]|nr:DUF3422 domain-containing protein [Burkholderiales bacterium]